VTGAAIAQPLDNPKNGNRPDAFRQLEEWLPTPNMYRDASGAPGPNYWQQEADYEIDIRLDDEKQRLIGSETIAYHNYSPLPLRYVWIQLDQNIFNPNSAANKTATAPSIGSRIPFDSLRGLLVRDSFDGGFKISKVADGQGNPLPHVIVDTMMRVDLAEPLAPGKSTKIAIDFSHNIVDATLIRARGGYEYFEKDENYIYEIAQWFPRVVAYTDYTGWQHKQFLGAGEFTLELGDYLVRITAPADHIVGATGVLQNPDEVLTELQRTRLTQSETAPTPVFIVTPEEAKENEAEGSKETKTWVFKAENVRDFAFASSRKFIWDAKGHDIGGKRVMAMSYYPNEAEPLWSTYSTASIVHTLNVYGRYTFDYPYPTAISVNGPVGGMEYPMICFNGPRPEEDGTYSARTKYGLISVVIHEVGHNFFPMIVNSDERQWTWMDEGLNTFLQYLAEQEWEENYPSRRGEPADITGYMRGDGQMPIMTNSESVLQLGPNAYSKPATALNILRETILGRELFDFAFREYSLRWKFKRPTPADFFRTMEDASGVDLDWFWRGWFYSTDHVDLAIENVHYYQIDTGDPDEQAERKRLERDAEEPSLSKERNKPLPKMVDQWPGLKDFYNQYDELDVSESDRKSFQRFLESLDDEEQKLLRRKTNFYVIDFANEGGLVMPVIFRTHYTDGSSELFSIPAEIWRRNSQQVSKLVITDKTLERVELDPKRQTADTDYSDNHWPPRLEPTRFELFKSSDRGGGNPMRDAREAEEKKKKDKEKEQEKSDKAAEIEVKNPDAEKPSLDGVLAPESAEQKEAVPAEAPAEKAPDEQGPAEKAPDEKAEPAAEKAAQPAGDSTAQPAESATDTPAEPDSGGDQD
jgi:hypothetical protein